MNILKTGIAVTLIGLTSGCADTEFRVVDTVPVMTQESSTAAAVENTTSSTPLQETAYGSGSQTTIPRTPVTQPPVVTPPVVETTSQPPSQALSCTTAFETGYMCFGGTGIVLNAGASAETQCRAYCEDKQAGCCSVGKTNLNSGKVYCHAGAQARVRYVNNYAQLFPLKVESGRQTEIKALNCKNVKPSTFTWTTGETAAKSCLQGFDFRLYGEVPANADVLEYTRGNLAQLEDHWHRHGFLEGRSLNRNWHAVRGMFNKDQYLAEQPDVLLAGVNPWSHYQSCGGYEGRTFPR